MNQLVALIVGCILFFWGISYFMNKSLAGISTIQVAKSSSFSTQSYSKCATYLSGAEVLLQDITFSQRPTGDCFAMPFPGTEPVIPAWKIRLYHSREAVRGFLNSLSQ